MFLQLFLTDPMRSVLVGSGTETWKYLVTDVCGRDGPRLLLWQPLYNTLAPRAPTASRTCLGSQLHTLGYLQMAGMAYLHLDTVIKGSSLQGV